ncbi:hypothetical protein RE92_24770 (plasmid) [Paenibacillus polymyxa]|nr:hypothetical protein RE92_24770 [Paenibacillus polymyxa]
MTRYKERIYLVKKKILTKGTVRILSIILAVIVTVIVLLIAKNMVTSNVSTEKIVVAADNIAPNQGLKSMLKYRDVIKSEVPADPIRDMKEVEDQNYFAGDIGFFKDQPITRSGITTSDKSTFGEALNLKKPNHFVGIKVDQSQSTGGLLKPGVIVDAVVYLKSEAGGTGRVIGPDDDPELSGLVVVGRENSEGTEPGKDGRSSLTSVVIVNAPTVSVYKKLVQYQEDGKIYLGPAGVKVKK